MKRFQYFIFFLLVVGCIEPYEFVIQNNEPSLVVEAYLSDKSFDETVAYPSDGRYFSVKLTSTGDVANTRPQPIEFARVVLSNDKGEVWDYTESGPGVYLLLNPGFKAESGVMYRLRIEIPDESVFESSWESLPSSVAPAMGDINFKEVTIEKYAVEANEQVVVSAKGVRTEIDIPENTSGTSIYYRWSFEPHWIYVAPLSSVISQGHICWATHPNYIRNYSMQLDNIGGYKKDLFFMETVRNERIFEKFSALIIQHSMRKEFYHFWREMQEQNEGGAILDKPPFNLATNFHAVNGEKKVSGYFGVVHEQAKRWYFDKRDLSYYVNNTLRKDCTVPFQDPAPECFDCREYSFGVATNIKPSWWID